MTQQEYDRLTDKQRFDLINSQQAVLNNLKESLIAVSDKFIRPKFDFEKPHEVKYDKNKSTKT